jgi:hypothetical protein
VTFIAFFASFLAKAAFLLPLTSYLLPLLKVILHFDDEDDHTAGEGDEVREQQVVILNQQSLHYEGKAADGHHDEAGQGDAVGVTRTNSLNSLGQITQNQTDAGNPAAKVN